MSNGHHSTVLAAPSTANVATPATLEPNDMEQIRDLLFGSQHREADRRFRTNERRLDELDVAFRRFAERVQREQIDAQAQTRDQQNKLRVQIDTLEATFQERLAAQQRDFDQRLDDLRLRVLAMIDTLDHTKLDHLAMADALIDLGTRMQRPIMPPATQA